MKVLAVLLLCAVAVWARPAKKGFPLGAWEQHVRALISKRGSSDVDTFLQEAYTKMKPMFQKFVGYDEMTDQAEKDEADKFYDDNMKMWGNAFKKFPPALQDKLMASAEAAAKGDFEEPDLSTGEMAIVKAARKKGMMATMKLIKQLNNGDLKETLTDFMEMASEGPGMDRKRDEDDVEEFFEKLEEKMEPKMEKMLEDSGLSKEARDSLKQVGETLKPKVIAIFKTLPEDLQNKIMTAVETETPFMPSRQEMQALKACGEKFKAVVEPAIDEWKTTLSASDQAIVAEHEKDMPPTMKALKRSARGWDDDMDDKMKEFANNAHEYGKDMSGKAKVAYDDAIDAITELYRKRHFKRLHH